MKNHNERCRCCLKRDKLTEHHTFPVRHFGRSGNTEKIMLCQECHNKLEKLLREAESCYKGKRFPKDWMYKRFINDFVGYKYYRV